MWLQNKEKNHCWQLLSFEHTSQVHECGGWTDIVIQKGDADYTTVVHYSCAAKNNAISFTETPAVIMPGLSSHFQ